MMRDQKEDTKIIEHLLLHAAGLMKCVEKLVDITVYSLVVVSNGISNVVTVALATHISHFIASIRIV